MITRRSKWRRLNRWSANIMPTIVAHRELLHQNRKLELLKAFFRVFLLNFTWSATITEQSLQDIDCVTGNFYVIYVNIASAQAMLRFHCALMSLMTKRLHRDKNIRAQPMLTSIRTYAAILS